MQWPTNPLAQSLRKENGFIRSVHVLTRTPPTPTLSIGIRWCEVVAHENVRRGEMVVQLKVPGASYRDLHSWCLELAWVMGSPHLERTDEKFAGAPGYPSPRSLTAGHPSPVDDQLHKTAGKFLGASGSDAASQGLTTWEWVSLWSQFLYLRDGKKDPFFRPAVSSLKEARRRDPELQGDGSRTLDYPWKDKPSHSAFYVMPIPADLPRAVRIYEFCGRRCEEARRRAGEPKPPRRRSGRSIPDSVLAQIGTARLDLRDLIEKIQADEAYAPIGEEQLAAFCLLPNDAAWAVSPLTYDEMEELNPCLDGAPYGS